MNRIKSAIFASVVMSGLATTIIIPIIAPLIRELRLSVSQGGWMISMGSIAMVATAAVWGTACDRFGRKQVMMAGFAGLFVGYVLYTATIQAGLTAVLSGSTLFLLLILTRALVGGFLPAVSAAAQALMADNTAEDERSSGMAIIGAASGVGLIVGPALSGVLALGGLIWPLVLTTALCLFALTVVSVIIPKSPARAREKSAPVNPFAPALLPWLLAGALTMYAIATMQVAGSFYFQDRLGLTTAQTGPMLAIGLTLVGLALLAAQVLQIKVLHWPARRMILVGAAFWLAGLVIQLFTANVASYFVSYALFGIGGGLTMPGFMAGASLAVPRDRQGAVAGFSAATQGIGFILGPVASTTLYEIDRALPFWCLAVLMAMLFLLFALGVARTETARA